MYTHLHILPQGRTAQIGVNEVTDSTKERARKMITDQSETWEQLNMTPISTDTNMVKMVQVDKTEMVHTWSHVPI